MIWGHLVCIPLLKHTCHHDLLSSSSFLSLSFHVPLFLLSIFFPTTSWAHSIQFSSVQSLSRVRLFATPWTTARQASLSITNSRSSSKLMSIESVMPSNHLILCPPLLLLPSIFPSIRVFSNESALCIRWPTYWSFSFNISPSNEHPGLISFRVDWLDLIPLIILFLTAPPPGFLLTRKNIKNYSHCKPLKVTFLCPFSINGSKSELTLRALNSVI